MASGDNKSNEGAPAKDAPVDKSVGDGGTGPSAGVTKPSAETQLSSDPNKDPNAPVTLDHGEPDPKVVAEQEANAKQAQDPWGDTPMQMRDQHDPAVDPATDDTFPTRTGAVGGLEPNAVLNEGDHPVQGTLPPI